MSVQCQYQQWKAPRLKVHGAARKARGIRERVRVGDSSFAFASFARAEAQNVRVLLRQLDPGSTGAVQQSLEMKADQPVVRPHPDEGREGRHGRRVTSH